MLWESLGQMVETTRVKHRVSIKKNVCLNLKLFHSLWVICNSAGNFKGATPCIQILMPQMGGKSIKFARFCQDKLILSWTWWTFDQRRQLKRQFFHVDSSVPCLDLGPPEAHILHLQSAEWITDRFSVNCNYPFASWSWSSALMPWMWFVVWRRWVVVWKRAMAFSISP